MYESRNMCLPSNCLDTSIKGERNPWYRVLRQRHSYRHRTSHREGIPRNGTGLGRDLNPVFNIDSQNPVESHIDLSMKLQKSEAIVWRGEHWSRQGYFPWEIQASCKHSFQFCNLFFYMHKFVSCSTAEFDIQLNEKKKKNKTKPTKNKKRINKLRVKLGK